jgi:splicing factor 3B subunit 3
MFAPRGGLQAQPESVLMLWGTALDEAASGDAGLFLHVGLSNGVLMRTEVDRTTGEGMEGWSRGDMWV